MDNKDYDQTRGVHTSEGMLPHVATHIFISYTHTKKIVVTHQECLAEAILMKYEPVHDKTYNKTCVTSKD